MVAWDFKEFKNLLQISITAGQDLLLQQSTLNYVKRLSKERTKIYPGEYPRYWGFVENGAIKSSWC